MKKLIFACSILLLLIACGGEETAPQAVPTAAAISENGSATEDTAPATTDVAPTTAAAVEAPAATLPPPPTVAPVPTSTLPPEASTVEPTATTEAIILLTAEDFGTNRNPLTGEVVDDPSVLQRRPFAVKLSNSPASYTRPQSGLNQADIVYEHTTEGYITRFTAIFYGQTPDRVGPIRSARLIDVELPAMYDAALFYSGSSVGVGNKLWGSDFSSRVFQETAEDGFYRTGEDKPFEHTLYGRPADFWAAMERRQLNNPPNFGTSMSFSDTPPDGGTPSNGVNIDHQWTIIDWQYDAESGRYLRWSDSQIHADGNTGEQVTAANVILIFPIHALDGSICEEARDGVCVHQSVEVQIWGSGSAIVLRDGLRYDVTWHREGRNHLLTFKDAAGNPFPLQIGNSWVQVIPNWLDSPVTILP